MAREGREEREGNREAGVRLATMILVERLGLRRQSAAAPALSARDQCPEKPHAKAAQFAKGKVSLLRVPCGLGVRHRLIVSESGVALRLPPQSKTPQCHRRSLRPLRALRETTFFAPPHTALSALITGSRAARIAGSRLPTTPTMTAKINPSTTSRGVMVNSKTISLKVSKPIVAVV